MDIDFPTKVITVQKTDTFFTLVATDTYEMDTNDFRLAVLDRLDDSDGIVFDDVFNHNTTVTLGGIDYARLIEVINGYTITFDDTGGGWIANLVGSNNNILDVTNLTAVQVRSNNSAGLIQVTSGSGLSQDQDDRLTALFNEALRLGEFLALK